MVALLAGWSSLPLDLPWNIALFLPCLSQCLTCLTSHDHTQRYTQSNTKCPRHHVFTNIRLVPVFGFVCIVFVFRFKFYLPCSLCRCMIYLFVCANCIFICIFQFVWLDGSESDVCCSLQNGCRCICIFVFFLCICHQSYSHLYLRFNLHGNMEYVAASAFRMVALSSDQLCTDSYLVLIESFLYILEHCFLFSLWKTFLSIKNLANWRMANFFVEQFWPRTHIAWTDDWKYRGCFKSA